MKAILKTGLISLFFSCGHPNQDSNNSTVLSDSSQTAFEIRERERLEQRKQVEELERIDSLRQEKVLKEALEIANQHIAKDRFMENYEIEPDSVHVSVEINLDFHFSKANPHLIIRRTAPGNIFIDIYAKGDHKFEKVVSHKQWSVEHINDTIQDINGDGLNDLVVNCYGSNGCCLKAFTNVYLLRSDLKGFSGNFMFINPTFSPKEKIIRGICYGHPGDTEMYKYKWNGEKIDTLEYVSYEKNDEGVKTGRIIISADIPYGDQFKILKVLNFVPREYRKIEGYDWFTGNP